MNVEVDFERLRLAHKTVHAELLAERAADGHWVGRVASSPLTTAAAISALVVAHRRSTLAPSEAMGRFGGGDSGSRDESALDLIVDGQLSELLMASLRWLARVQNADGGWGDCESSRSNLAATALVQAAFRLTGVPGEYADLMAGADRYVAAQGGVAQLRRRGDSNPTLAACVLANCALAGVVPWRLVPALPFELHCPPQNVWQRLFHAASPLRPVEDETAAAQIAVGMTRFHFQPPRNPLTRFTRRGAQSAGLAMLNEWQAADGSFLAAPTWTAFVVMSLASIGYGEHRIVQRGVEYLLSTVRADASWPIVADLATRNTALAVNCLASDVTNSTIDDESAEHHEPISAECVDWILACQHASDHRPSSVSAGGWSWSDSPGAAPNVSDTSSVLISLARTRSRVSADQMERIHGAAERGLMWLLDRQHDDGGWPQNCAKPASTPTHSDCADTTSDALCALAVWNRLRQFDSDNTAFLPAQAEMDPRINFAVVRGLAWLASKQRADGSFTASAFGNQHQPDEKNPVYGTSRVLAACVELGRLDTPMAQRAADWLARAQHVGGGWGPARTPLDYSGAHRDGSLSWRANETLAKSCSVEETSWAVAALVPFAERDPVCAAAVANGLIWLAEAVEQDLHRRPAAVGVWPAKLWYDERLYPLVFAADALSRAVREFAPPLSVTSFTA